MNPRPTGRVRNTATGADLVITRSFRAPIEDVWRSLTASESTARWIGPWEGGAGPGTTVRLQMAFEKGAPSCDISIDACEPPHRLAVSMKDDHGDWRIEVSLTTQGETTELMFVQHLTDPALAGDAGPGWEYYLDMLAASRLGEPLPDFADYYPAQRAYYLGDARAQE